MSSISVRSTLSILTLSVIGMISVPNSASGAIVNLAQGGTASATSDNGTGTPNKAIDGVGAAGAAYPAVWHSGNEQFPALTVNLGNVYNLGDDSPASNPDVTLGNRTDCCGFRLTNLRFEVFGSGGTATPALYSVDFDPAGATTYSLELPAVQGQYFRLTKLNPTAASYDDNSSINLAEIQVFGDNVAVPEPTSLAAIGIAGLSLLARRRSRA